MGLPLGLAGLTVAGPLRQTELGWSRPSFDCVAGSAVAEPFQSTDPGPSNPGSDWWPAQQLRRLFFGRNLVGARLGLIGGGGDVPVLGEEAYPFFGHFESLGDNLFQRVDGFVERHLELELAAGRRRHRHADGRRRFDADARTRRAVGVVARPLVGRLRFLVARIHG